MMISTTSVLFLIWTLSPKFSRKLLPLVSSLAYCLTHFLLHSNLPIACYILLKPHFSVFTMTSSQRWSVVRSLLLFFLIYLLPSILSIIPFFFIVFENSSVFTALLLAGVHLILPHVIRQSPYKNPLHLPQIFLLVYLKVPSLTYFFTLFIQPLWLCHLQELNQIPPLCWRHPVIHLFRFFKLNYFTRNTV